jgi:hypothetical protein
VWSCAVVLYEVITGRRLQRIALRRGVDSIFHHSGANREAPPAGRWLYWSIIRRSLQETPARAVGGSMRI